jgi:hypothetical protein
VRIVEVDTQTVEGIATAWNEASAHIDGLSGGFDQQ